MARRVLLAVVCRCNAAWCKTLLLTAAMFQALRVCSYESTTCTSGYAGAIPAVHTTRLAPRAY